MKKQIFMNHRAFTLIELLAVIVVLAIIFAITIPIILNVVEDARKGAFTSSVKGVARAAENEYLVRSSDGDQREVVYTFENGEQTTDPVDVGKLNYSGRSNFDGYIRVYSDGSYELVLSDGELLADKETFSKNINETVEFSGQDLTPGTYIFGKPANAPVLATGMTPIKWDGSAWINTTEVDPEWYDYEEKKWANVQTADGSFWVWIPRYAYRIKTGYNSNEVGEIDIRFLEGSTNEAGNTDIDLLPTYSGNSQTNFVLHPSFTLGTDSIEGFWVAKFQASLESISNLASKPNSTIWGNVTPGQAFNHTRTIRTRPSLYGFIDGEIDSFMLTNRTWGAIAYLAQSEKGKNSQVWVNNNSNYTTGCAGDSVAAAQTTACNQYHTEIGQNASTTGNIYGVYDMSGAGWEFVASYIDNGDSVLTSDSAQILTANMRYKDPYLPGATDTDENNYLANASYLPNGKFGDAIYETSSLHSGWNTWYGSNSAMPRTTLPYFVRGGRGTSPATAGIFNFMIGYIAPMSYYTFRPVIVVY